jgi:hypothetical protein
MARFICQNFSYVSNDKNSFVEYENICLLVGVIIAKRKRKLF